MSLARRQRTTYGVSQIGIEDLAEFIFAFIEGKPIPNPRPDFAPAYSLKYAVEDMKSYYIEAVTAQPGQGQASSHSLETWFWDKTLAGEALLKLKRVCQQSQDPLMAMIGSHFIVPGEVARRKKNA